MGKHRIQRMAGEIKRELAEILEREIKDPRLGLVSVVSVQLSPDGSSAKIYVSPLGNNDKAGVAAARRRAQRDGRGGRLVRGAGQGQPWAARAHRQPG